MVKVDTYFSAVRRWLATISKKEIGIGTIEFELDAEQLAQLATKIAKHFKNSSNIFGSGGRK